jgi:hypothetical protein
LREEDHLDDIGVDGRTLKINFKEVGRKGVDWINPVQDKDNQRDVVSMVMNFQVA